MAYSAKRNGGLVDATPAKAHKGPGSDDPNAWSCSKCGNVNFGNRVVCNMRSCGAPKEQETENWVCPGCGNENYATRVFCNMRRCQQVRPGTTMAQIQAQGNNGKGAPARGGKGDGGKGGAYMAVQSYGADPRAAEPGAWTCGSCGNLNYAGRTVCNSRSCGKPQAAAQSWGGGKGAFQPFGGGYDTSYAGGKGYDTGYGAVKGYGGKGGGGAAEKPPPPGSWQCSSCQNVNWPNRDTCNAKACGQPRSAVDGGAPKPKPSAGSPEGSWVCPGCQNTNFPQRTFCNKRTCGLPKPE